MIVKVDGLVKRYGKLVALDYLISMLKKVRYSTSGT